MINIVIKRIQSSNYQSHWLIESTIRDIREILLSFSFCSEVHIHREGNVPVHLLVKWYLSLKRYKLFQPLHHLVLCCWFIYLYCFGGESPICVIGKVGEGFPPLFDNKPLTLQKKKKKKFTWMYHVIHLYKWTILSF